MTARRRPTRRLFLGLGANLGDRAANLRFGLKHLGREGVVAVARSAVYETEPVGRPEQPPFLNQVVEVRTDLSAAAVLEAGRRAETELGRVRDLKDGPRTLDVDVLMDGETILDTGPVILPHPRLHLRRFVLVPFAEIAANVEHPTLGRTIGELLEACEDPSDVRPFS